MTHADPEHLHWPFFDDGHRAYAREIAAWCARELPQVERGEGGHADTDEAAHTLVQRLVPALGRAGLLRACVAAEHGGARDAIDVRTLAIARETLARASGLADFALAMQGLGSVPVSLFGNAAQQRALLPAVARGEVITAFALSEPEAGSDAAAMQATAVRSGDGWVLNGTKTWISNAGIADSFVVFARSGEASGAKGISAFIVRAGTPGLDASVRIPVIAPHPLGTVRLTDCRVGPEALLGEAGQGFRIAMGTLDLFRTTVGAAALGFARRALDEAVARAKARRMFGRTLAEFQLTQARLGEMATLIDASALLIYRSAWTRDVLGKRVTREASMAKMYATEAAQQVIDGAVQLFGGLGVVRGNTVERLYREIRALRIYEGASEVLQLVIGGKVLEGP